MSRTSRYPVIERLAASLFPVFWNEFLFRLNSCHRKGVAPEQGSYFASTGGDSPFKLRLLETRYVIAALIQIPLLIFGKRMESASEQPVFLFTNLRHRRFFRADTLPVRVGLYNLRYLKYPHLLSVLSVRDWLWAATLAWRNYQDFRIDCFAQCQSRGVSAAAFYRLTLCGRLRHFDAILHAMALEKLDHCVWIAGHFDCYSGIASLVRESGGLPELRGCQHGLVEFPPAGLVYEGLFTDHYEILFPESEKWVVANFLKNDSCSLSLAPASKPVELMTLPRTGNERVVAYACQELVPWDDQVIDRLRAIQGRVPFRLRVIVYTHPLVPEGRASWKVPGIEFFKQDRHGNIDLLVTRYSTLGLDYHRQDIPVLFLPFDDGVCIFEHPEFNVCANLEQFERKLLHVLGTESV